MLNRYSLWKNLLLIMVILIALFYALPNFYGEDPALQITSTHGTSINATLINQIRTLLEKEKIEINSIALESGVILIRFNNPDIQLRARESLMTGLGDKFIVALNLAPATPKWLEMLGAKPIKLGLDLCGGVHFLIEVDIDTAIRKMQTEALDALRNGLRENNIPYVAIERLNNNSLEVNFLNDIVRDKAMSFISLHKPNLILLRHGQNVLKVKLSFSDIRKIREDSVTKTITILRHRINRLGVDESLVQRQGSDRIVVELPGIQDTARAKEILGATATLEFRLVNTTIDATTVSSMQMPSNSEVKYVGDGYPIVLYKNVILTGDHITDAVSSIDEYNKPQVNISLDRIGGLLISKFSKDNIGKTIATLFVEYKDSGKKDENGRVIFMKQEEVINLASIQSRLGNSFRITGISNFNKARHLVLLLRAGTLITPIKIVEERIIGPTLGNQNITQGLTACVCGLFTSIIFMVTWYRHFGVIATSALLVDLLLIISLMSLLPNITLSMPGIAGIVLTLAVAVDASVLINERIKEELKNGRSVQKAIHEGYKGAFSSIIDANITTLIIAIILYIFGTGAIKGFAITTAIGVATSMFSSILGTRAIVNLLYGRKRINKLSI